MAETTDTPSSDTAPKSASTGEQLTSTPILGTPPVARESTPPAPPSGKVVRVQVPPEVGGAIQIFDGAVWRVYDVVAGVAEVALEDLDIFLGHVTGATAPEASNPGATATSGSNPGPKE
ncbi:MAG: hypothetical protein ABR598_07715 [Candidatus Dormibacteria bacterium]